MPKVYSILQLPFRLSITGSKLLAQLHATVWEFLRVFSVNVRESIARRYSRPPRTPVPSQQYVMMLEHLYSLLSHSITPETVTLYHQGHEKMFV